MPLIPDNDPRPPSYAKDREAIWREIRALWRLNHPSSVTVQSGGSGGESVAEHVATGDPHPNKYATPTHTHPTSPASLSTTSAGLPSFSGRVSGDLHYNQTDKKEYVLTGAAGAVVTDDFNRADGLLHGTTTPVGGKTYTVLPTSLSGVWAVTGNQLVGTYGYQIYNRLTVGDFATDAQNITVKGFLVSSGYGGSLFLKGNTLDSTASADWSSGYSLVLHRETQIQTAELERNGVQVATVDLGDQQFAEHVTNRTYELRFENGKITALRNGVVILTYTDPTPLTGVRAGVRSNFFGGNDTWDDLEIRDNGTLAWTSTDEFVATHSHGTTHQITEGPGVPPIAGRAKGDLHNDLTGNHVKILTDKLEASISDAFSTDGALHNRITEVGGKTWAAYVNGAPSTSTTAITGGRLYHASSDVYYGFSLSGGDQDVEWSYQFPGTGGNNWQPFVKLRSDGILGSGSGGQGYEIMWSSGTITIKRNNGDGTNPTLLSESTVMSSSSNDATKHLVRARFISATKTVEVYYDGALRHTVTDPGTPPAGAFFYIQGREVHHDDFRASASANTRWEPTHTPTTVAAGLPSTSNRRVGDMHFDTATSFLYVNVAGTWTKVLV